MGQNRLVIARCAGNGGARVDRRIASRKFAIVQEEDQRVPRFGAADQAKARHQAVSLVCEWRAPQSRPNSLASRRAPACSSRGAAASQATAAPTRSTSIRPRSAASLMSIAAVPGVSTKAPGVMRSEEHTSELQSLMPHLVCRLLLEKKKYCNKTQT